MKFITFTKLGRTLLLATATATATATAGAVWLAGCGGGDKPSELVGHWEHYEGAKRDKPEDIELFKDGTGVLDRGSINWKVENKRLVFLSALQGLSCNYKVSGYELILAYDGGDSATFVRKGKLEEYKKQRPDCVSRRSARRRSRIDWAIVWQCGCRKPVLLRPQMRTQL
jgi:hypothetical protein